MKYLQNIKCNNYTNARSRFHSISNIYFVLIAKISIIKASALVVEKKREEVQHEIDNIGIIKSEYKFKESI
jgi:hypothetical protein